MKNKNLEYLDSLELEPAGKDIKKNRSKLIGNAFRAVIFIICLGTFIYSIYNLLIIYASYNSGDEYYNGIAGDFEADNDGLTPQLLSSKKPVALEQFEKMLESEGKLPDIQSNEELEELFKIRNKLNAMKQQMPDLYGWIDVEGTNMKYPVVYSDDNNFYLDHAADKSENFAGAIFVDMRCTKPTYATQNLLIHGHNVRSWGMMFNGIVFFFEKPYFDSHKTIKLYTFDGIYEYTIISIREVVAGSDYSRISPRPGQTMSEFVKEAVDNSAFKREGITYDDNAKLITLSTCSNYLETNEMRFALIGLMTHSITDNGN